MEQTVIALGFFDGVHVGHGVLLRTAVERARAAVAIPAAFTFDRSPREVISGKRVPLLTTPQEREALMREQYGIERVIVGRFDRAMMTMPWAAFLESLRRRYGAVALVAGHDYRFGWHGAGDAERLRAWCAAQGLGCDIVPPVVRDGSIVSSTRIRAWIDAGEMECAAAFLGRPYELSGPVAHGQGLGSRDLFPTANLIPDDAHMLPCFGVYASRVTLPDGQQVAGVTDVGVRPTVGGEGVTVETHLLDFSGDLYGKTIRVAFLRHLRGEMKFASIEALQAQIARDIAAVRASNAESIVTIRQSKGLA